VPERLSILLCEISDAVLDGCADVLPVVSEGLALDSKYRFSPMDCTP
jgi:hypothetical protein